MSLVKVVLLGAPGVGKSAIIQQFVLNDFTEPYSPTDRKHAYFPSVMLGDRLYELKITDVPLVACFPTSTQHEWNDYRYCGLRSATAYILVFDLANVETFQYVRTLREQIFESRDMRNVPLLIVGNKLDLLTGAGGTSTTSGSYPSATGTMNSGSNIMAITTSSGPNPEYREKRRDIVNLVKKHWKCGYVECSAKYNWRVISVFKELMRAVDSLDANSTQSGYKEVASPMMDNFHDAMDRNKCNIL